MQKDLVASNAMPGPLLWLTVASEFDNSGPNHSVSITVFLKRLI